MTLPKTILKVLTVGAILSCVIPGAWSQTNVGRKTRKKAGGEDFPCEACRQTPSPKPRLRAKPRLGRLRRPQRLPWRTNVIHSCR